MNKCKSCGKEIVWLKTLRGRSIPVNADTVQPGDKVFNYINHVSHLADCPRRSESWRRRNQGLTLIQIMMMIAIFGIIVTLILKGFS